MGAFRKLDKYAEHPETGEPWGSLDGGVVGVGQGATVLSQLWKDPSRTELWAGPCWDHGDCLGSL